MRIAVAASVIGLTCLGVVAQTTTPKKTTESLPKSAPAPKPKPGVVSGRVFAITAGGDIKPARLARVYLLYSSIGQSAGVKVWSDQLHVASVEYIAQIKNSEETGDKGTDEENSQNLRIAVLDGAPPSERNTLKALAEADIDAEAALKRELLNIRRSLVYNNNRWSDEIMCRRELLEYDQALLGVRRWRWEHKEWNQFLSAQADEEGLFRIAVPRSGKYLLIVRGRAGFNEAVWTADVTVAAGVEAGVKLGQPGKACLVMQ